MAVKKEASVTIAAKRDEWAGAQKEWIAIKAAYLKDGAWIPGGLGQQRVLDEIKAKGVSMTYDGSNLWCEYKGNKFVVPRANISSLTVAE